VASSQSSAARAGSIERARSLRPSATTWSSATGCSDAASHWAARPRALAASVSLAGAEHDRQLDELGQLVGARAQEPREPLGVQVGEPARDGERERALVQAAVERGRADHQGRRQHAVARAQHDPARHRLVAIDERRWARHAEHAERATQGPRDRAIVVGKRGVGGPARRLASAHPRRRDGGRHQGEQRRELDIDHLARQHPPGVGVERGRRATGQRPRDPEAARVDRAHADHRERLLARL